MLKFRSLIAVLTLLIAVAGLSACSESDVDNTVPESSIAADRIFQQIDAQYDEATGYLSISANFNVDNSAGASIVLGNPSSVKLNSQVMGQYKDREEVENDYPYNQNPFPFNDHHFVYTICNYYWSTQGSFDPNLEYTLEWTSLTGQHYVNKFKIPSPIDFGPLPQTLRTGTPSLRVSYVSGPLKSDERVGLSITDCVDRTGINFAPGQNSLLLDTSQDSADCDIVMHLEKTYSSAPTNATAAGGVISSTYYSPDVDIKVN